MPVSARSYVSRCLVVCLLAVLALHISPAIAQSTPSPTDALTPGPDTPEIDLTPSEEDGQSEGDSPNDQGQSESQGQDSEAKDGSTDGTTNGGDGGQEEGPVEAAEQTLTSVVQDLNFDLLVDQNDLRHWAILLGAILGGLLLGKLLAYPLERASRSADRGSPNLWRAALGAAASPLSLFCFTVGLSLGLAQLNMGTDLREFSRHCIGFLYALVVFWFLFNIIGAIELLVRKVTGRKKTNQLDDQILPLLRKSLRVFLVVVAVLFLAENFFGADIGAWLAGLGIAGLAVSLAAQDSLKNLFGSITIMLDRPFKVDDFIQYDGNYGTVEEIGFRSSRLRLLTGHLLTVPNSNIVNDPVENLSARPSIRRVINITIPYDTSPANVEKAIEVIQEVFEADGVREAIHNEDDPEDNPPHVSFNEFNADSLNLCVYYWHRPPEWWSYLDHATRFNLELFSRFREAGIDFAFPTRTLFLANDPDREMTVEVRRFGDKPDDGDDQPRQIKEQSEQTSERKTDSKPHTYDADRQNKTQPSGEDEASPS